LRGSIAVPTDVVKMRSGYLRSEPAGHLIASVRTQHLDQRERKTQRRAALIGLEVLLDQAATPSAGRLVSLAAYPPELLAELGCRRVEVGQRPAHRQCLTTVRPERKHREP
jgi:hypothetical protein